MGSLDNDNKFLKSISSKNNLNNTTTIMTTTISKNNLQQQEQPNINISDKLQLNTKCLCVDSMQTNFIVDSINNNNNHQEKLTNDTLNNAENNLEPKKLINRRSLLNFKSFDFHLKHLYSGLIANGRNTASQASNITIGKEMEKSKEDNLHEMHNNGRLLPYLRIETADSEESKNLLVEYTHSPYTSRRNSSYDDNRTCSQLLQITQKHSQGSRSQANSPGYLSPYSTNTENNVTERRSSTSDIVSNKGGETATTMDRRRPSTSDLLRKARERRGTEARLGASTSHGGLSRGGFRPTGRRTSMAF